MALPIVFSFSRATYEFKAMMTVSVMFLAWDRTFASLISSSGIIAVTFTRINFN